MTAHTFAGPTGAARVVRVGQRQSDTSCSHPGAVDRAVILVGDFRKGLQKTFSPSNSEPFARRQLPKPIKGHWT